MIFVHFNNMSPIGWDQDVDGRRYKLPQRHTTAMAWSSRVVAVSAFFSSCSQIILSRFLDVCFSSIILILFLIPSARQNFRTCAKVAIQVKSSSKFR